MVADRPEVAVERSLCYYRGEEFVCEVVLHDLSVDRLRRILGQSASSADPLLYDCYPVEPAHLIELGKYAREPLPQQAGPEWSIFVETSQA
jgi:hypothetical protein